MTVTRNRRGGGLAGNVIEVLRLFAASSDESLFDFSLARNALTGHRTGRRRGGSPACRSRNTTCLSFGGGRTRAGHRYYLPGCTAIRNVAVAETGWLGEAYGPVTQRSCAPTTCGTSPLTCSEHTMKLWECLSQDLTST